MDHTGPHRILCDYCLALRALDRAVAARFLADATRVTHLAMRHDDKIVRNLHRQPDELYAEGLYEIAWHLYNIYAVKLQGYRSGSVWLEPARVANAAYALGYAYITTFKTICHDRRFVFMPLMCWVFSSRVAAFALNQNE